MDIKYNTQGFIFNVELLMVFSTEHEVVFLMSECF